MGEAFEMIERREALEDRAHADHAANCPVCSEQETIRTHVANRYLATDDARKALKEGIEAALVLGVPADVRRALQLALTIHGAALLSRI